jgi:hypothetical protein
VLVKRRSSSGASEMLVGSMVYCRILRGQNIKGEQFYLMLYESGEYDSAKDTIISGCDYINNFTVVDYC